MTADLLALAIDCGAYSTGISTTTGEHLLVMDEQRLAAYAARIRAEALEEAAKEALRHTTHPDDPANEVWQSAYNHVATEIAAAIRALAQPPGEKT